MKKWAYVFGLLCVAALTFRNADAAWVYDTSKQLTLTITVTPSPIGYSPFSGPAVIAAKPAAARAPLAMPVVLAYDPFRASDMIAATSGTVPSALTVLADPKYGTFHFVIHTPVMSAGYGPNTYTCVYEVFGHEPRQWQMTDWVYGSNTTGGGSLTTWPTNNYPTPSDLQWLAEGITTSFTPFANSGQPGETPFGGAANTTKQVCFDLSLNVANSVPAGTYQTTIQYSIRIYF